MSLSSFLFPFGQPLSSFLFVNFPLFFWSNNFEYGLFFGQQLWVWAEYVGGIDWMNMGRALRWWGPDLIGNKKKKLNFLITSITHKSSIHIFLKLYIRVWMSKNYFCFQYQLLNYFSKIKNSDDSTYLFIFNCFLSQRSPNIWWQADSTYICL